MFDNGVATFSVPNGLSEGFHEITLVGISNPRKFAENLGGSNQIGLYVQNLVIAEVDTFAAAVQVNNAWFTFRDAAGKVWRVRFVAV